MSYNLPRGVGPRPVARQDADLDAQIDTWRRRRYEQRAQESLRATEQRAADKRMQDAARTCRNCGISGHINGSGTLCTNCGANPKHPARGEHRAASTGHAELTPAERAGLPVEYTPPGFGRILDVR